MSNLVGQTLGHYRVVERIGAGGMGEVYRARDERLGREVAIKVLPEDVAESPGRLERFEREAKLLASLNHPNIATLHGLEETGDLRFLVMELVEGEDLEDVLTRGAIAIERAVPIALQMANALEAAHICGVVHRDLKPANVMVDKEGRVKVLDFGLAKALETESTPYMSPESVAESPTLTADLTRGGIVLGTAAYMSPEQTRGTPVDTRADIWAFGVILFEMLTGSRLFAGATATDTIAQVIEREPEWDTLPDVTPVSARRLLRRCLNKDPSNRLHDIADARIELQALADGEDGLDAPKRAVRPSGPSWIAWGLVAALAMALLAVAMSSILSRRDAAGPVDVSRFTLDLPDGVDLSSWPSSWWKPPVRNELALSPDGRTLVFSAAPEPGYSNARLYRRSLDSAMAEVIPGTDGASSPFFSPDGAWVAYWADGTIKKVDLEGGLPIPIGAYRDPSGSFPFMGGTWAPDGTIYIGAHMDGIHQLSEKGGELRALTIPDRQKEYSHRLPQILPGGRALLFTVAYGYTGAGGHIEAISLKTGERTVVVDAGLDGRYVPTGHLLFLQHGTLMAVRFDVDRLEVSGRPVPVLDGVAHATNLIAGYANSGAGVFATSNDGTLLFAPGDMAPDILHALVWVDRSGATETVAARPQARLGSPRISPDGRKVAFITGGLMSSLWVFDLERQTTTRLTDEGRVDFCAWTPDGEGIVFGYSRGGVPNLHLVPYQGNGPIERLTTSNFVQQPGSWTPDGRHLAYVQWVAGGTTEIWLFDMEDRETAKFLSADRYCWYPAFSPDGRWLAYGSDETGMNEVWVTSFPDQKQRFLVSNDGGLAPVWSPDGRAIYYRTPKEDDLVRVDVSSEREFTLGRPERLFKIPWLATGPIRSYDITPDGGRFIFCELEGNMQVSPPVHQLQVVVNWFEDLKRLVP